MEISVTLWANAGISLQLGEKRVWIDPFSVQKEPGFSLLDPVLVHKIRRHPSFLKLDACCFTHKHGDHYSAEYASYSQRVHPDASFFVPEERWGPEFYTDLGGVGIRFLRLPHEGAQYADVLHYGIILTWQDKNILISGDCAVAAPELAAILDRSPIHLAILNFPWLTLQKGRDFLGKYLENCPILLVHLPFAEDDRMGYRAATVKECAKGTFKATPLMDPLETITVEI